MRFGLFHVLQAGARAEQRPIAAKGLTGWGYDGHVFWDMESFVLPVLTYTKPRAAGDALRRRIGRDEIGIVGLELLELVQQGVELFVRDFRSGMNVVPLFVMADLFA